MSNEKQEAVSGNAAKMHEALVEAQRVLHCAIVAEILKGDDAQEALNVVTAALSATHRNCDVGTVEDQLDRYGLFCQNKCPMCELRGRRSEMRKIRCRNGFKENYCHGKSLVTDAAQAVKKKEQPMSETKNALAELAERLSSNKVELVEGDEFPIRLSREAVIDFRKAQLIVEELAKVSDGHWEVICDGPEAYLCTAGDLKVQCAIGRCRAIAEEGANDDSSV